MPEDQIVKAVGDLASELRKRINVRGKEEMSVLKKMNEILSNETPELTKRKHKTVTFKDPIPEPRVARGGIGLQRDHRRMCQLQGCW